MNDKAAVWTAIVVGLINGSSIETSDKVVEAADYFLDQYIDRFDSTEEQDNELDQMKKEWVELYEYWADSSTVGDFDVAMEEFQTKWGEK